jgi:hypothetical protein
MTAKNPTSCESNTFHHPMTLEGFKRVGRASWIVTATGWKERRYCQLVAANQENKYGPHCQRVTTSAAQLAIASTCLAS